MEKINTKMLNIINQMSPFGPGNMLPVFKSNNLRSTNSARVLKDKHLKLLFFIRLKLDDNFKSKGGDILFENEVDTSSSLLNIANGGVPINDPFLSSS